MFGTLWLEFVTPLLVIDRDSIFLFTLKLTEVLDAFADELLVKVPKKVNFCYKIL